MFNRFQELMLSEDSLIVKKKRDKLGMNLKKEFNQRSINGWVSNLKVNFKMFPNI